MKKLLVVLLFIGVVVSCSPRLTDRERAERKLAYYREKFPELFDSVKVPVDIHVPGKDLKGDVDIHAIYTDAQIDSMELEYFKKSINMYIQKIDTVYVMDSLSSEVRAEQDNAKRKAYVDSVSSAIVLEVLKLRKGKNELYQGHKIAPITIDTSDVHLKIWIEDNKVKWTFVQDKKTLTAEGVAPVAKCPNYEYTDFREFWIAVGVGVLLWLILIFFAFRNFTKRT